MIILITPIQNSSGTAYLNRLHWNQRRSKNRIYPHHQSKILDNKSKTDSPKTSDNIFNTTEAIEEAISSNR